MPKKYIVETDKGKFVVEVADTPSDQHISEPTDYWGGFRKGANDYLTEVGRGLFEGAAHPKTAADFAGLMLPTTMGMGGSALKGLKAVSETEPVGNKVVRGATNALRNTTEAAGRASEAIPATSVYAPAKLPLKLVQKAGKVLPSERSMLGVDSTLANKSGYRGGPTGAETNRIPYAEPTPSPAEGAIADPHLPNKSGYEGPDLRPFEEMPQGSGVDPHLPNKSGYTGPDVRGHEEMPQGSGVDPHLPNKSGYAGTELRPHEPLPTGTPAVEVETAQEALARKGGEPFGGAVQTDRIPYGAPQEAVSSGPIGQVGGKAPTLQEVLQSALEESMGKAEPAQASTLPDPVSIGGMQKPKTPAVKGKNPAQGAPGGYVTDNPPKPAYGAPEPASAPAAAAETPKSTRFSEANTGGDELGKLLDDIHGTTENDPVPHINPEGVGTEGRSFVDTMKSTDPEFSRDVHTGAEPKSPEAESARVHHQSFGEMDANYKRRISDPLGALLMALVGGEAASKQPNDQRD